MHVLAAVFFEGEAGFQLLDSAGVIKVFAFGEVSIKNNKLRL